VLRQDEVDIRDDCISTAVGYFDDYVANATDNIGVVAAATVKPIASNAPVKMVTSSAAIEIIVTAFSVKDVVPLVSIECINTRTSDKCVVPTISN
jgi:hypothetical protein